MNNQRYPLELGISGIENMNFLYNTCDYGQLDYPDLTKRFSFILTLMQDGRIYGYRTGYENCEKNMF